MSHWRSSIATSIFFPGAVKRGTYARCLIKIAIIWAFHVVVMRLTDRLSAAVHVPDNRAASIIPHFFHFFPTSSLSNKDETLPQRAVLRPKGLAFVLTRKEVWTSRVYQVTDYPRWIFTDANLNTAYAIQ